MGFYREGTRRLESIDSCPILTTGINLALKKLKETMVDMLHVARGLCNVVFEEDVFKNTFITMNYKRQDIIGSLTQCLNEFSNILGMDFRMLDNRIYFYRGSDSICFYKDQFFAPKGLFCKPTSFFQANMEQNRILVKEVVHMIKETGEDCVVDFFCGSGNFSIPLARTGFRVTGVEIDESAIEMAKKNALLNRCSDNVIFLKANLFKDGLNCLPIGQVNTVLLDPPRVGAKELCQRISSMRPKNIVYVSCDPMTLARDMVLLGQQGYKLKMLQPIDMFPQTFHIEIIALFNQG